MFLLLVVQWLHILAGITWFGGYIFLDFVLWPTPASAPGEACTGPVWEEDGLSPGVVGRLRLGTIFEMMCFGLVLACMVVMGVGL